MLFDAAELPSYQDQLNASENDVKKFKRDLQKKMAKAKDRILNTHGQLAFDFANHEQNRRKQCTYTINSKDKKKPKQLNAEERRNFDLLYKDCFDHKLSKQTVLTEDRWGYNRNAK